MEQITTSATRYSVYVNQTGAKTPIKIRFTASSYSIGTIVNMQYRILVVEDSYPYVTIQHFVR